ncbi:hypothetical protein QPK31_15765 [Massilia sp. YIM B02769]|nr:hypothetical protein [Massilia sp. YIM B02769]MDN4059683.1 hypothetical protein [Massilia sp. YIM B02769]
MLHTRFVVRHALPALLLGCALSPAQAMTAVEKRVDTASAPHLTLGGGGKTMLVHYVQSKDDHRVGILASNLADLKQKVAFCVEANRRLGRPVRAPREFPEQVGRTNAFEYSAPNRRILYTVNYSVRMADDCSLVETEDREASLSSVKGSCEIDLVRKTAHGVCDRGGHADAVRTPLAPGREQQEKTRAALEADPRMAKQMAVLRRLSANVPASGEKLTIAGLECEVVNAMGSTSGCITRAGSFIPTVGLEGVSLRGHFGGLGTTAVAAKLDMPVNPAIFTPYVNGGFTITAEPQ